MESSVEVPQKTKRRPTIQSSVRILGIYPKECKLGYNRDTCTFMFTVALFTIAKLWKQPKLMNGLRNVVYIDSDHKE
jgi:hypothetical protein